jgi:nickel-dependent lactate racemase
MAVGKKKVVINSSHRVIGAFAGDMEDALAKAEEIAGRKASVTFLPEGMSAIKE